MSLQWKNSNKEGHIGYIDNDMNMVYFILFYLSNVVSFMFFLFSFFFPSYVNKEIEAKYDLSISNSLFCFFWQFPCSFIYNLLGTYLAKQHIKAILNSFQRKSLYFGGKLLLQKNILKNAIALYNIKNITRTFNVCYI